MSVCAFVESVADYLALFSPRHRLINHESNEIYLLKTKVFVHGWGKAKRVREL